MPFGLTNAPATFQRLMDLLLAGLEWKNCLVYLDDIIISGSTFNQHLNNLKLVFERLRKSGLKLHTKKCHFCKPEVQFLGHIISNKGVATDPEKTNKVANWPVPKTRKEVQQFLGFANYYRRFIRNFATIAKPPYQLTEMNKQFCWSPECQQSFECLKKCLVSSPILALPDFNKPLILDTDASDTGIGAVLSQVVDGKEQVISYACRILSSAERKYCVTRRELLALVIFMQQFRPYLLGRHFKLRTDHGSLTWLQQFKNPEGQLARWLERLQEFDFDIVHRKGNQHTNADSLSRLPCHQCGRNSHTIAPMIDHASQQPISAISTFLQNDQQYNLAQLQQDDNSIGVILHGKLSNLKPKLDNCSRDTRRLCEIWSQLEVHDGILWRHYQQPRISYSHLQLVVPECLPENVLQELHEGTVSGHLGVQKLISSLKDRFYWPGHVLDATNWCNTCHVCATRKSPNLSRRAPLQPVVSGFPLEKLAVDILGPLPVTEKGNKYILVVSDYFTRWVEAYPMPNQEASTVAQKLVDEFFCRFSCPTQLHSDQGRQFESSLIQEVCKLLNIRKSRTTPYHPAGDGLVERFNRTLLHMLSTTVQDHNDWENRIRPVCMAYNSSTQTTTGFSPFYLMFGRQPRLPIDLTYGSMPTKKQYVLEYVKTLNSSLEEAYQNVKHNVTGIQDRQKEQYDKTDMTHQSTCSPGYKFPNGKPFSNSPEVGHNLELCEDEDPIPGSGVERRYPTRTRIPPLRYSPSSM